MSLDILYHIQTLQFQDKEAAENLLITFIRSTLSLPVANVELRPLAVSLNSFNGFMTLEDGKRLFFKTHSEADNVITEYYNAQRLSDAGYPVIQPVFSSTEAGKQLLIYEVIHAPSVFDVAWTIENGNDSLFSELSNAQNQADDLIFHLYKETLALQEADKSASAPIHQLFYHRLTGGRLTRFYGESSGQSTNNPLIHLTSGSYKMHQVRQAHWRINGQVYKDSLDSAILKAVHLLDPAQSGASVIGHGDAHNGNVFFEQENGKHSLVYFDPAFAGQHDPLLDVVKPLFHNVFAMWMYFPEEKTRQTQISLRVKDNLWEVEHDYQIHPVRLMFLSSKLNRVISPLLKLLRDRNLLRIDWRDYLKSALFCCPFLTMNLTDTTKFTPEMSLLGLAMSVEMGLESKDRKSQIDTILDELTQSLI